MMAMVVAAVAINATRWQRCRRSQQTTMTTTAMMMAMTAAAVAANATMTTMMTATIGGGCSPKGKELYYPDDDVFLDDIFDDDYVEKHFLTIPDEAACDRNHNWIMGGPQPPGPNAMEEKKRSYEGKQKAFTHANRRTLLTALSSVDMNVPPQKQVVMDHTGDQFSIFPHAFNESRRELAAPAGSHICWEGYNDATHWRRVESLQYQLSGGRSGGISQRRHTTSLHHCDRNVNRLRVWYNMNATNYSCDVHKIVHWKKVRYYRWSKIHRDVLWISIIQSEAIQIME